MVIDREAGVAQDRHRKTAADVDAGMDRHGDRYAAPGMKQGQVAARLSLLGETLRFEETHKLARRDLRHPRHQDIPTVSSST